MRFKKLLFLFIIIVEFTVMFTIEALVGGLQTLINLDEAFKQIDGDAIYITLQHESNPLELPHEQKTLRSFEELFDSLHNIDMYTYYEIYRQPLDITRGSGIFYDEFTEHLSEEYERSPCIQISENVQYDFGFSISNGRLLYGDDFYHKNENSIPVLMGYDYSHIYDIGKTFTADYLFSTYSFKIVGFLEENRKIVLSTGTIEMDKYIIMPSFKFENAPQTDFEYVSQVLHNANRTSGKIKVSSDSYDQVCTLIQSVIQKSAVGEYSWTSNSLEKTMIRAGMDIYVVSPVLLALSFVLLIVALYLIYRYFCKSIQNKSTLSFSLGTIFKKICSLVGVLFISIMLSLLLSSAYLKTMGLAHNNFWGVYGGIATFLVGALIIIKSSYRK